MTERQIELLSAVLVGVLLAQLAEAVMDAFAWRVARVSRAAAAAPTPIAPPAGESGGAA